MQTIFGSTLPVNELTLQIKRDGVYSENVTGQGLSCVCDLTTLTTRLK